MIDTKIKFEKLFNNFYLGNIETQNVVFGKVGDKIEYQIDMLVNEGNRELDRVDITYILDPHKEYDTEYMKSVISAAHHNISVYKGIFKDEFAYLKQFRVSYKNISHYITVNVIELSINSQLEDFSVKLMGMNRVYHTTFEGLHYNASLVIHWGVQNKIVPEIIGLVTPSVESALNFENQIITNTKKIIKDISIRDSDLEEFANNRINVHYKVRENEPIIYFGNSVIDIYGNEDCLDCYEHHLIKILNEIQK